MKQIFLKKRCILHDDTRRFVFKALSLVPVEWFIEDFHRLNPFVEENVLCEQKAIAIQFFFALQDPNPQ